MSDKGKVPSHKFIQITVSTNKGHNNLYALSEDGIVYWYDSYDKIWRRMTTQRIG